MILQIADLYVIRSRNKTRLYSRRRTSHIGVSRVVTCCSCLTNVTTCLLIYLLILYIIRSNDSSGMCIVLRQRILLHPDGEVCPPGASWGRQERVGFGRHHGLWAVSGSCPALQPQQPDRGLLTFSINSSYVSDTSLAFVHLVPFYIYSSKLCRVSFALINRV